MFDLYVSGAEPAPGDTLDDMARRSTGTIVWVPPSSEGPGHYKARIRFTDGSRPWVHLPPEMDENEARLKAASLANTAKVEAWVSAPKGAKASTAGRETVGEWFARFAKVREARGQTSVADDVGRFKNHIAPHIGTLFIDAVERRDLEMLVEALDAKIRTGYVDTHGKHRLMSWRMASHVWGVVTSMFDEACASKSLDLRARETNPAASVRGPDRGVDKTKQYLYPAEFSALMLCERVPPRWRRIYALAVYLYARAGELEALTWGDVDLTQGVVHIHQSIDRARDKTKATKTGVARRFTIEPELLPLLRVMHTEAGGKGAVATMPPIEDLAPTLRDHLRRAGVTRASLFADDLANKQMTFHDLRATGVTWMAIRGDDPIRIKRRAGHASFSTTEGYIHEAEDVREGFGQVFAPLPVEALSDHHWSGSRGPRSQVADITEETSRPRRDSKPNAHATPRKTTEETGGSESQNVRPVTFSDVSDRVSDHSGLPTKAPPPTLRDELGALIGRAVAAGDLGLAQALLNAAKASPAPVEGVVDFAAERAKRGAP